jgi:hypothetical protein
VQRYIIIKKGTKANPVHKLIKIGIFQKAEGFESNLQRSLPGVKKRSSFYSPKGLIYIALLFPTKNRDFHRRRCQLQLDKKVYQKIKIYKCFIKILKSSICPKFKPNHTFLCLPSISLYFFLDKP